jgi:hypothetical protein
MVSPKLSAGCALFDALLLETQRAARDLRAGSTFGCRPPLSASGWLSAFLALVSV